MATVVDIFCGAGGLTHGFILEGFNVSAGVDVDPSCRYPYEQNNPNVRFIEESVEELSAAEVLSWYPAGQPRILVGCAPCQPFSSFTNKVKNKADQWRLVDNFASLILNVQPDIVSMENVTRLKTFKDGAIFQNFVNKLEAAGYFVTHTEVYCPDYGIPQQRKRLVLFASKKGNIELIAKTHSEPNYPTVRDAISHLPPLKAGAKSSKDNLHRASQLDDINLKRIRQSRPGGTWLDWDEELRAACHKKTSGRFYKSVYGRMEWDKPSPTITTQAFSFGTGRFGHPEQDRALSLREMATLQTFPEKYAFVPPNQPKVTFESVGVLIGNAVPVLLGRVIAQSIQRHLDEYYPQPDCNSDSR